MATLAALVALGALSPAWAHPVPFSYLELHVADRTIAGTVVVHAADAAHELKIESPATLLVPGRARELHGPLTALLSDRLIVDADGERLTLAWQRTDVLPEHQSVRLHVTATGRRVPGVLAISARLFPYDPVHQTFVTISEGHRVAAQAILDASQPTFTFYPRTVAGTLAVVRRFVRAGVHHIAIGPDHVLFLIGLLLLGGGMRQLAAIVTAFTLGHSVTLALAVLDLWSPPAQVVEPAIALSIVYVGADNLLAAREGRDLRPVIALAFGLIHGFGFASVLKELDLPASAIGWSLAAFNAGVELGQLAIVVTVASVVAMVHRRVPRFGARLVMAASCGIILAGAAWFIERVFFSGGLA